MSAFRRIISGAPQEPKNEMKELKNRTKGGTPRRGVGTMALGLKSLILGLTLLALYASRRFPTRPVQSQEGDVSTWNVTQGEYSLVGVYKTKSILTTKILHKKSAMTWSGYVSLLKRDKTFRAFFSYALAKVPFKGYYWECNPVKSGLFDRLLEMAFVESSQLSDIKADSKRFDMHIQKLKGSNSVSVFPNLGRDAYLIVPAQSTKNAQTFAHLAAFVRNAPEDQKQALWEKTGKTFQTVLEQNKTVWVSTHGTGVYWLHVRIDTRPKYYSYTPFTKL